MSKVKKGIDIIIDQLTNSIIHVSSGDKFETNCLPIIKADLKLTLKKNGWLFSWKYEFKQANRVVYKIVTDQEPDTIQGLVSLSEQEHHIELELIESAPHNRGTEKLYLGVAANMFAFACYQSKLAGHEGNIAFIAKTELIDHYESSIGAIHIGNHRMIIHEVAAEPLINRYFKDL